MALNVIEQHLSKFSQFEVCGKSTDPIDAIAAIKILRPDLLFLDIEMPDITGLELIDAIQFKPEIIITTAYREFAVEGFEKSVLDYLVKPIPIKRFIKAIDKFLEKEKDALPKVAAVLVKEDFIFVKADRKSVRINLSEILYVEGVKDYVKIILIDNRIITKVSIGNFANRLPTNQFIRVHKSFIVAKNKITAYTSQDVEIGKVEIPIGRMYKEQALIKIADG